MCVSIFITVLQKGVEIIAYYDLGKKEKRHENFMFDIMSFKAYSPAMSPINAL